MCPDCGYGDAFKAKKKGVACQCVKSESEIGLKKKREKDEAYRDDSDEDDPTPTPIINPFAKPTKPKATGDKPRVATLFNI